MYYGEKPTVIPQGQQMPLSFKQAGDLPQGLVESRSREIPFRLLQSMWNLAGI